MTRSGQNGERAAQSDYRPSWQCTDCGAIHETRPEACDQCGCDDLRPIELR